MLIERITAPEFIITIYEVNLLTGLKHRIVHNFKFTLKLLLDRMQCIQSVVDVLESNHTIIVHDALL